MNLRLYHNYNVIIAPHSSGFLFLQNAESENDYSSLQKITGRIMTETFGPTF